MIRGLILVMFFYSSTSLSQDVHFSQFNITKSLLNPSLTGYQNNDFQIQLQRRAQWQSVTTPFTTFSIAVTRKEIFKQLSGGFQFINDVSGDSHFSTNGFSVFLSNAFKVSDISNFSFGASLGSYQRSLDYSNITFIDDEDIPSQDLTFIDISLGLTNEINFNPSLSILSGMSFFHINKPNQAFISHSDAILKINKKLHATIIYYISNRFQIKPSFLYSYQGSVNEFIIGTSFNYLIVSPSNESLLIRTSIFNRYNDAIIPAVGIKINNFDVMLSYDINTSSLVNASDHKGGFEFAIIYQWSVSVIENKINKQLCPKYL